MHNDDDPPQRRRPRPQSRWRSARERCHVAIESEVARLPLGQGPARRLALHVLRSEGIQGADVAINFVGKTRIARLHSRFMGRKGPTDIVTLEHARGVPGAPVVGEIYIAPSVARDNALALGVPVREEVARLVVHGVLHALGWDHPDDDGRTRSPMWLRQEALLESARRAGVMES